LIDICTATGQRIYPIYPDNGYPAGYVAGNYVNGYTFPYVNGYVSPYVNTGYVAPTTVTPYVSPFYSGSFFNGLYGTNFCNVNVNCNTNTVPSGATNVGGVLYYNDNRFCGDGKIAFVPGQGYFCQNGGPLVQNGATTVNCSNFFYNGCGTYTVFEASSSTTTSATTTTQPAAQNDGRDDSR
jgi:hypothetical protein